MRQLSGLDHLMVSAETANAPLHMGAVFLYNTGASPVSYQEGRNLLKTQIDQHFPQLKCHAERVALHLDTAYWVADPHFSIDYHVQRVALPSPANWDALYEMAANFHAKPLDNRKPLWQSLWVEGLNKLEGVPTGATALIVKIHHALMDGKSAERLFTSLHSLEPQRDAALIIDLDPKQQTSLALEAPGFFRKYGRASWRGISHPINLTGKLLKAAPSFLQKDASTQTEQVPIPETRFNQMIHANRVMAHIRLPLTQLQTLEHAQACTINDIALAIIGGGLRKYLQSKKDLPTQSLVTGMPIDVRNKDDTKAIGNEVSFALVSLHTDIKAPLERLRRVHESSTQAKQRNKKHGSHFLLDLVDNINPNPIVWLGRKFIDRGWLSYLPPMMNTIITNVPGTPVNCYLRGAPLLEYIGMGPMAPNIGLFHVISSTSEYVSISFLSCREFIPQPEEYRLALAFSAESLLKAGLPKPKRRKKLPLNSEQL